MITQNVYWKHLAILKSATKTITVTPITIQNDDTNIHHWSHEIVHTLKLRYKGDHGIDLITSIKTSTKKIIPEKYDVRIILTSTKLGSQFNIQDNTKKQHRHDLVGVSSRLPLIVTSGKKLNVYMNELRIILVETQSRILLENVKILIMGYLTLKVLKISIGIL